MQNSSGNLCIVLAPCRKTPGRGRESVSLALFPVLDQRNRRLSWATKNAALMSVEALSHRPQPSMKGRCLKPGGARPPGSPAALAASLTRQFVVSSCRMLKQLNHAPRLNTPALRSQCCSITRALYGILQHWLLVHSDTEATRLHDLSGVTTI